jgi:hypothetical protein
MVPHLPKGLRKTTIGLKLDSGSPAQNIPNKKQKWDLLYHDLIPLI